jgi:hypothetical protein
MLADPKAGAFAANFAGQWLQSRGVLDVQINSEVVMKSEKDPAEAEEDEEDEPAAPAFRRDFANNGTPPNFGNNNGPPGQNRGLGNLAQNNGETPRFNRPPGFGFGRGRFRRPLPPPGTELTPEIREAMKQEAEAYFGYIVREDRSLLELLDSTYTFVNEHLAPVYGITNVVGTKMQRVELPEDSVRGGVLTMGSVLTVTSNPTRTSPVNAASGCLRTFWALRPLRRRRMSRRWKTPRWRAN